MPAESLAEKQAELVEIKAAISKTLKAQAYGIAGRSKTNPALAELYKVKRELIKEIDSMDRGGIRVRGVTPGD